MMVFSPIDDATYDTAATQITYCKLFPLILEDFLTRNDGKEMMKTNNLPVTTDVTVNPGQVVSAPPPSGAGSTTSPGKGSGTGNVQPVYDGGVKLPADEALAKEKEAIKNAGGQATGAVLNTALGG